MGLVLESVMSEEWKSVVGYEGSYEVSSLGRVRSLDRTIELLRYGKPVVRRLTGRVLRAGMGGPGVFGEYFIVCLGRDGKNTAFSVHRLVCFAFCSGHSLSRNQVNHLNSVKTDNRACNLEWCSQAENRSHAIDAGTMLYKLSFDDADDIRSIYADGWMTQATIGRGYGVCKETISGVVRKKRWVRA